MKRTVPPASLLLALALVLAGSTAACRPRVPPPELAAQVPTARAPDYHAALAGYHAALADYYAALADYHAALAAAFAAKADEYAADAGAHRRLADAYTTEGTLLWERHHDRSLLRLADHCNRAAEDLAAAAAELNELAREHQEIAQKLGEEQGETP